MSSKPLEALLKIQNDLYKQHPLLLPKDFSSEPITFPPKIRAITDYVIGHAEKNEMFRVILKGPRGGGKSRVLASLELILWHLYQWDVINLGGSFTQAEKVYTYLIEAFTSKFMEPLIKRSVQRITESRLGSKIFVLAATEKQTRSPHIGGATKGGLLTIDEECEAEENVVTSALPTINSAHPSGIIRSSTFHKSFGTFQKTWDNAEAEGYMQFTWDCFDVSEKCLDDCEKVYDKATKKIGKCNVLEYCNGRAHSNAEKGSEEAGWTPIEEIRQQRREMSADQFEVEMMGWRPSGAGLVFLPDRLAACVKKETFKVAPSGNVCIGVDWGFEGETAVVLVQEQLLKNEKTQAMELRKRVIEYEVYTQTSEDEIYSDLVYLSNNFQIPINLDMSHKFQNDHLANMGASITEVSFALHKERCIGYLKMLMEKGLLEIPEAFEHLIFQLGQYRRGKTGKPIKKDDHGVDALICAILHFTDEGIGYSDVGDRFKVVDPYKNRPRIGRGG